MLFNLPQSRLTCRQEHPDGYRCERGCWRAARGSDVRRQKRVLRSEQIAWTLRMSSGCFWWSICCADCWIPTFCPGSKLPQPKASKMQQTKKIKTTQKFKIMLFLCFDWILYLECDHFVSMCVLELRWCKLRCLSSPSESFYTRHVCRGEAHPENAPKCNPHRWIASCCTSRINSCARFLQLLSSAARAIPDDQATGARQKFTKPLQYSFVDAYTKRHAALFVPFDRRNSSPLMYQ